MKHCGKWTYALKKIITWVLLRSLNLLWYTLKIQRLYFIIQKKILYRWFHINGNTLYALEILFPFYISSIQKCLLTATQTRLMPKDIFAKYKARNKHQINVISSVRQTIVIYLQDVQNFIFLKAACNCFG